MRYYSMRPISFTARATREWAKLPSDVRGRIDKRLTEFAATGRWVFGAADDLDSLRKIYRDRETVRPGYHRRERAGLRLSLRQNHRGTCGCIEGHATSTRILFFQVIRPPSGPAARVQRYSCHPLNRLAAEDSNRLCAP